MAGFAIGNKDPNKRGRSLWAKNIKKKSRMSKAVASSTRIFSAKKWSRKVI